MPKAPHVGGVRVLPGADAADRDGPRRPADHEAVHVAGEHLDRVLPARLAGVGRYRRAGARDDRRRGTRPPRPSGRPAAPVCHRLAVDELELNQVDADRVRVHRSVEELPDLGRADPLQALPVLIGSPVGDRGVPAPSRLPLHLVLLIRSATGVRAVLPPLPKGSSNSDRTSWRNALAVTLAARAPAARVGQPDGDRLLVRPAAQRCAVAGLYVVSRLDSGSVTVNCTIWRVGSAGSRAGPLGNGTCGSLMRVLPRKGSCFKPRGSCWL